MYNLDLNKEGSVADHFDEMTRNGVWNIRMRRDLNNWEVEEFASLLDQMNEITPNPRERDKRIWTKEKRDNSWSNSFILY